MNHNGEREDGRGRGRGMLLSIFRRSEDQKSRLKASPMMRNECAAREGGGGMWNFFGDGYALVLSGTLPKTT